MTGSSGLAVGDQHHRLPGQVPSRIPPIGTDGPGDGRCGCNGCGNLGAVISRRKPGQAPGSGWPDCAMTFGAAQHQALTSAVLSYGVAGAKVCIINS